MTRTKEGIKVRLLDETDECMDHEKLDRLLSDLINPFVAQA